MKLQLLLLLLNLSSESMASVSDDNTGQSFIIVFPENIAYYHPVAPTNQVLIIALFNNTEISLTQHVIASSTFYTSNTMLNAGETKDFTFDALMELNKSETSFRSVRIKSTKSITVHAISLKDKRVQTALVIPTEKQGKKYFIPPIPTIQKTTSPAGTVSTAVTERSPFKLIIVNMDQENSVTVEGVQSTTVSLQPFQIAQIWVKQEMSQRVVKANLPVTVLFGHSCAMNYNCTCGMLYTTLPPARTEPLKYYIPPALSKETGTFVLLSDKDTRKESAFDPDSPLVQTSGTAVLFHPGLLLTLIPETEFGSCFAVFSVPDATNLAVIMVHKDHTDGVRIRDRPPESPDWQVVIGSNYVSASFELDLGKHIIWHTTSTMAVYFVGRMGEKNWFGNPAPIISKSPDFRGCALTPEVVEIGKVAGGWRESLQYCKNKDLDLVSFPNAKLQMQIYKRIVVINSGGLQEVWIGMRRSSVSGEWYWVSGDPVEDTNWAEGEPGSVHDGQCVIISLETGRDFGWSDESCCKDAHPVCYGHPQLLPM